MKEEGLVYGIDFGTSNSAIAVSDKGGRNEVLKIGRKGSGKTIRSVLFFPSWQSGQVLVGDSAISEYVDSGGRGRFLQSIKSVLPDKSFTETEIQGFGFLSLENLIAMIIGHMKKTADDLLGVKVDRLVLGRPARFSKDPEIDSLAEKRLLSAARKAGFREIYFQLEPIAAALHYESSLGNEKMVLVADIGGGTSDFTVMRLSPDKAKNPDRRNDILSSCGVYIGGDSFGSDIMWNKLTKYFGQGTNLNFLGSSTPFPTHILSRICQWESIVFMKNRKMRSDLKSYIRASDNPEAIERLQALINDDLGYFLFSEIERAKIALSDAEQANIDFERSIISITERINRIEFEKFISGKIKEIIETIEETMRLAGVHSGQIDAVFMTGGSSLIPAIRKIFSDKFGEKKIVSSDFFTSVASGLALSSRLFF